jgi:hypothetical protein
MDNIEENRRHIINLLDSNKYVVEEFEELILASKYCERSGGGTLCFLVEATSPYKRLKVWGSSEIAQPDPDVGRILAELNEKLLLLG